MPTNLLRRNITLGEELWTALLDLAGENRTNASEEIRKAVTAHLEANGWDVDRDDSKHLTRQKRATSEPAA